jgi:hypothetical protein
MRVWEREWLSGSGMSTSRRLWHGHPMEYFPESVPGVQRNCILEGIPDAYFGNPEELDSPMKRVGENGTEKYMEKYMEK